MLSKSHGCAKHSSRLIQAFLAHSGHQATRAAAARASQNTFPGGDGLRRWRGTGCKASCITAVATSPIQVAPNGDQPAGTAGSRSRAWQRQIAGLAMVLQAISLVLALIIQISHLRAINIAQEGVLRQDATLTLLLISLAFGFIHSLYSKARQKPRLAEPSLSSSGSARLARVEVLQNRQIANAAATERDLGNVRTRLRVLTKDIQPAVRQLQAENSVQAEALAKLSERLQGASQQVDDTQQMLAALQSVAAKQLQLVVQALDIAKANGSEK